MAFIWLVHGKLDVFFVAGTTANFCRPHIRLSVYVSSRSRGSIFYHGTVKTTGFDIEFAFANSNFNFLCKD